MPVSKSEDNLVEFSPKVGLKVLCRNGGVSLYVLVENYDCYAVYVGAGICRKEDTPSLYGRVCGVDAYRIDAKRGAAFAAKRFRIMFIVSGP